MKNDNTLQIKNNSGFPIQQQSLRNITNRMKKNFINNDIENLKTTQKIQHEKDGKEKE